VAITRQAIYLQRNIAARSFNNFCGLKAICYIF